MVSQLLHRAFAIILSPGIFIADMDNHHCDSGLGYVPVKSGQSTSVSVMVCGDSGYIIVVDVSALDGDPDRNYHFYSRKWNSGICFRLISTNLGAGGCST